MQHQLSFLIEQGSSIARTSLDAFCARVPWFDRSQQRGGTRWSYANPDTSVTLDLHEGEPFHGASLPDGFDDARLSCSVPYLRPGFFAVEAMDVIAELCTELGLTAFAEGAAPTARAADLVASWRSGNRAAARAAAALGALPPKWSGASAELWWRYARDKARLQASFDDAGVFVPRVFLFVDAQRGSVVRMGTTWSDCIATIFPPSDLVLVLDKSNMPTASGQDTRLRGVAHRDDVVAAMEGLLERVDTPVGELPYLPPDRCALARARFRALRVDPSPDPSTFRGTSPASCIDDEDARDASSAS